MKRFLPLTLVSLLATSGLAKPNLSSISSPSKVPEKSKIVQLNESAIGAYEQALVSAKEAIIRRDMEIDDLNTELEDLIYPQDLAPKYQKLGDLERLRDLQESNAKTALTALLKLDLYSANRSDYENDIYYLSQKISPVDYLNPYDKALKNYILAGNVNEVKNLSYLLYSLELSAANSPKIDAKTAYQRALSHMEEYVSLVSALNNDNFEEKISKVNNEFVKLDKLEQEGTSTSDSIKSAKNNLCSKLAGIYMSWATAEMAVDINYEQARQLIPNIKKFNLTSAENNLYDDLNIKLIAAQNPLDPLVFYEKACSFYEMANDSEGITRAKEGIANQTMRNANYELNNFSKQ